MSTDPLSLIRARLDEALVAVDFDGTLAPIVASPSQARPTAGTVEVLCDLVGRVGQLAVITGRPAAEVVALAGLGSVPGLVVMGHYGMQHWADGELSTPSPVPGVAAIRGSLDRLLPVGGTVEDKEHSVAVHVRGSADPAAAHERLRLPLAQLAASAGLEAVAGRYVWELRPPGVDKGGALRALVAKRSPAAVLVAGDDLGDLPMFTAARSLQVPVACVAVLGADAPVEVAQAADVVVAGPAALLAVLRSLLAAESPAPVRGDGPR